MKRKRAKGYKFGFREGLGFRLRFGFLERVPRVEFGLRFRIRILSSGFRVQGLWV